MRRGYRPESPGSSSESAADGRGAARRWGLPGALLVGLVLLVGTVDPAPGFDTAWRIHPPGTVGLSAEGLAKAYRRAEKLDRLTSLLVGRRGRLVGESYWRGLTRDEPVNVKSASKSVLSALVGIALAEGVLEGLDRRIASYFPEVLDGAVDPRKRRITLRHLLLMRSGLASTSFEGYGPWVTSENWVRYVLERPMEARPGRVTRYSTGNSHLVAVILHRALGRDLRDWAQAVLFDPLDARIHAWQRDPQGYRFGGNNMYLTPRGLYRFGRMYRRDGRADGRQVVPARWVEESTRSLVHDTYHGFPYGYYWWNRTVRGYRVDFAWGHGGQFVFVVPRLKLVMVTTSVVKGEGDEDDHLWRIHDLLSRHVIPAVEDPPPPRREGGLLDWLGY